MFCRITVRRVASSRHFGFTRFPQPKLKSTKCGITCLKIPGKDPDFNLAVFMDAGMNPGPPEIENSQSSLTLHSSPSHSPRCLCLYSHETLLSLRHYTTSNLSQDLLHTLKDLDILRFRGGQAGKQSQNRGRQVRQRVTISWKEQICVRITSQRQFRSIVAEISPTLRES